MSDHSRHGLRQPPRGHRHVRVGNDVLSTAKATGLNAAVIVDIFN